MQSTAQSRNNRAFCAVNRTKSKAVCVVGNNLAFITEKPSVFADNGKERALFYYPAFFVIEIDYIRLLGIKQLSLSMGIGSSHIQMIPPFPRFREALSNTLYFLISRRSGAALFLISNG